MSKKDSSSDTAVDSKVKTTDPDMVHNANAEPDTTESGDSEPVAETGTTESGGPEPEAEADTTESVDSEPVSRTGYHRIR